MPRPRTKKEITCQNHNCLYYQKENGKDILKRGKNRAGHQQYYCNHCNKWFVETCNTPFYHKHLKRSEIIHICKLLLEKNSIRNIERITGHHRDTICHLIDDITSFKNIMNEILINDEKINQEKVDDMWIFINKIKRKLNNEK